MPSHNIPEGNEYTRLRQKYAEQLAELIGRTREETTSLIFVLMNQAAAAVDGRMTEREMEAYYEFIYGMVARMHTLKNILLGNVVLAMHDGELRPFVTSRGLDSVGELQLNGHDIKLEKVSPGDVDTDITADAVHSDIAHKEFCQKMNFLNN